MGDAAHAVLRRAIDGGDDVVVAIDNLRSTDNRAELLDFAEEGGEATYSVTAIDLAGNESAPIVLTQSLGCAGSCAQADAAPLGLACVALALWRRWGRRGGLPH